MVPLVDRDDERAPAVGDEAEQRRILLRDGLARVHDADHDVRVIDRLQRLDDAPFLEVGLDARPAPHARRVDEHEAAPVALERDVHRVARRARLVEGDHALLADESVDEGRLADVGTADHADADLAVGGVIALGAGGLDALEHALHEVADPAAMRSRDGVRLAEAEGMELRGDDVRVAVLALVDGDRDGLAALSQHVGDEPVRGIEAALAVDQEDDAVRFFDGAAGLARHELGQCRAATRRCRRCR